RIGRLSKRRRNERASSSSWLQGSRREYSYRRKWSRRSCSARPPRLRVGLRPKAQARSGTSSLLPRRVLSPAGTLRYANTVSRLSMFRPISAQGAEFWSSRTCAFVDAPVATQRCAEQAAPVLGYEISLHTLSLLKKIGGNDGCYQQIRRWNRLRPCDRRGCFAELGSA